MSISTIMMHCWCVAENAQYLQRTITVRFRCLLDNTSGFIVSWQHRIYYIRHYGLNISKRGANLTNSKIGNINPKLSTFKVTLKEISISIINFQFNADSGDVRPHPGTPRTGGDVRRDAHGTLRALLPFWLIAPRRHATSRVCLQD